VPYLKEYFEKNAGKTSDVLKYFIKHPYHAIIPAAGLYGAVKFGQTFHPIHQMYREETKDSILNEQQRALGIIIDELKKTNKEKPKPRPGQRIIKPPLA